MTCDCAIVGGGVIGLSIAYQLSGSGVTVAVIDRPAMGRKASWAGAGILSPANASRATHPLDLLRARSNELHERWAEQLKAETGIDNGFRKCGGLYLASTKGELMAHAMLMSQWDQEGVDFEEIDARRFHRLFPSLSVLGRRHLSVLLLPGECQVRSPNHLKALAAASRARGVQFLENAENVSLQITDGRIQAISTRAASVTARQYCFAAGAWTGELLEPFGGRISVAPIRGQIILFKLPQKLFEPIINIGSRYLVPRDDGHVLAGSTIEDVGFDCSTTENGHQQLFEFANRTIPDLNEATRVDHWAGLRPASFDGFPYVGRVAALDNALVATGHFKLGLQLSTATAVVMAQLIRGEEPEIDLTPFRIERG